MRVATFHCTPCNANLSMGHKARTKTKNRVILRHGEGLISKEFLSLFAFYYSTTCPKTVAHFRIKTEK
jgi:hypothetical protein